MSSLPICWKRPDALSILNPDAETVEDAVFAAVNSNRTLELMPSGRGRSRTSGSTMGSPMDAEAFLADFLSADRDHVQAVVVGSAGTGKSHFIHWMRLNIPADEHRVTINIPRSGTSLRGILKSLVDHLPPAERTVYEARLGQSGSDTDPKEVRLQRLIVNIGLALRTMRQGSESTSDPEVAEVIDYLLPHELPKLFMDPFMQPRLARPGGVIEALTEHIGIRSEYSRQEQAPVFTQADFALAGVETDKLAAPTRELVATMLGEPQVMAVAARLVNESIPAAIGAVLNFTGDQLIELLGDIRRSVHRDGKEIVLLIEDLARVHGLDQAMLEALMEARSANKPDLARLRWAMAVTEGFYHERVPEAAQQRMTFEIDMDATARGRSANREEEVAGFAARYLNAVRTSIPQLQGWYEGGASPESLPNPCLACPVKDPCAEAFGKVGDTRLFPFSRPALVRMLRVKDSDYPESLNPRSLVGPVLNEVLGQRYAEFEQGQFPSGAFLARMGGGTLAPTDRDSIRTERPDDHDRYVAVVQFWGDGKQSAGTGVFEAFSLNPLTGMVIEEPRPPIDRLPLPEPEDLVLRDIRAWSNGAKMPEATGRTLKGYVFEALMSSIDWDAIGLDKATFAGASERTYFGERDIVFADQQTNPAMTPLTLLIPSKTSEDRTKAAIALSAIASLRRSGEFPREGDPRAHYVEMARHLRTWGNEVADNLRAVAATMGSRAALPARLLLLSLAVTGTGPSPRTAEGWAPASFADSELQFTAPDPAWAAAVNRIRLGVQERRDAYLATGAAMKGGSATGTIDGRALLKEFESLEGTNWLSAPPKVDHRFDGKLARIADELRWLTGAAADIAKAEWARQRTWFAEIDSLLAPDQSIDELKVSLSSLRRELQQGRIAFNGRLLEQTLARLDAIDVQEFESARQRVLELQHGGTDPALPDIVEPARVSIVSRWLQFRPLLDQFLSELTATIERSVAASEVDVQAQRDAARVDEGLTTIAASLSDIGGRA